MDYMEGALLKMKKGITGANWKKNWVYADHESFYQWQIGVKPTNGEAPKYTFDLTSCKVEESQLKKFAFKITDPSDGTVAVYAADDFDTYEKWIKVLFGNSEFKESVTTEERSDMISNYSEDFKQFASDAIADFFFAKDHTKDSRDPVIEEKDLRRLLHTLDASLNVSTTAHMVIRDLKIKPGGTISRSSFQEWWSNNQKYFHSGPLSVEDAMPSDLKDRVLYAGFVDTHIINGLGGKSEFLFKARIPKYTTVESFDAPSYDEVEDWNTTYQECREQASITQSHVSYSLEYTAGEDIWSNYRIPPSLEDAEDAATATEPEAQVEMSDRFNMEDAVHACLNLAAFKGSFNQLVTEGAKVIVDELTLPEFMKTARKLPKESQLALQTRSGADSDEDLYEYGGVLFRVVACEALEVDRKPTPARNAQLSNTEELLHKAAGTEQQSSLALEQAIESLYSEYQMREHWQHLRHHEKQQTQSQSPQKDKKKFEHLLRPCTLLSTVVDYAGYRLVALCPLHIVEQFSLVHGYVEQPQKEVEPEKHSQSSDGGGEAAAPSVDDDPDDLFVNALPAYRTILPLLAAKLNVKLMKRKLCVSSTTLFTAEESNKGLSNVEILTEELQAHKGMDDRLYVLNTHGLLPNDLARDDTADPLTRYLRPEFVSAYRKTLPTDGFTLKKYLHRDQVDLDNEEDTNEAERKAALDSAQELIEACASLYKVQIPLVARLLDSLSEMTPTDSYGLTRVLHSYGINMRHIGLLYPLCKTPCVRQLLLIEAIARSCKVILKQSLRRLSRKCQAESLMALHRGRSKNSDFTELMDVSCAKRKDAVLELFNTVFASNCNIAASDEFWNGILSDVVFRKFGIDLRVAVGNNRLAMLHFPQLFAAMQYHTECRFKDVTYNLHFGGTAVLPSAVFTLDHLSHAFIPSSDLPLNIPGELGHVAANAEAYLLNGVLSEAINAFQLKLTMLTQLFKADEKGAVLSFPQQAQLSETIYMLALCLYKNKQYSESRVLLRRYVSHYPQYTVVAGRMFTLLMCVEFKSGCYDKARVYFDAAQCIYNYTLSIHHPIASLHMCTMSDLYKEVGCLAQAKALLMLAHTASRKALGEYHMVNAMYENKLAVLHMLEGNFKEATVLLSNCLTVYDLMASAGANLDNEIIDCLHSLTDSFAMCEEIDLAIHSGFRCVELCTKSGSNLTVHVSVLLILSDLFVQKHELESAFELLHESWTSIRSLVSTTVSGVVGQALARLSAKILELIISTLPMQTRSLFESVAEDVLMPKSDGTATEGLDQESWSRACDAVLEAIWTNKPYDYFLVVLQGIQHHEIGGKGATKKLKKDLVDSTNKVVSFPVQAAILSKLLQNPMSFSQRLISF